MIDVGALNVNGSLREVLPKRAILDHDENNMASNHKGVTRLAKVMGVPFQPFVFPAGSMFWFRPEALQAMCAIEAREFDIELGQRWHVCPCGGALFCPNCRVPRLSDHRSHKRAREGRSCSLIRSLPRFWGLSMVVCGGRPKGRV